MRDHIVIDHLRPWPTAVSVREIAAGTGLSLAETRQAVATLVAKGALVVQPGGPSGDPRYMLNLVWRPTLLRVDR
jgi:DNA-binding IclR family transcriptional regulator